MNLFADAVGGMDLSAITTEISNVVKVILPVGISVFGLMAGVKLVPKLIKRFM